MQASIGWRSGDVGSFHAIEGRLRRKFRARFVMALPHHEVALRAPNGFFAARRFNSKKAVSRQSEKHGINRNVRPERS
jgi:hypothetical protein